MPCLKCSRRVLNHTGENVWYCVCGCCNFCHVTGVSGKTQEVSYEHFFEKKGSDKMPKRKDLSQSHGGHGYIPMADVRHK
jgi:hypothetical protein